MSEKQTPFAFAQSVELWGGMTLRDYFAAKIAPALTVQLYAMLEKNNEKMDNVYEAVALSAYKFADEMIEVRTK